MRGQVGPQDAPDLQDGAGLLLHAVAGGNDALGHGPLQVGAGIGHDAIGRCRQRPVRRLPAHDGVVGHARRYRQARGGLDEGIGVAQVVDAVGQAHHAAAAFRRLGAREPPGDVREPLHGRQGQGDEVGEPARDPVPRHGRAAVGRGDEDGPADLRQRVEAQERIQFGLQRLPVFQGQGVFREQGVPQGVAGVRYQQPREHAAHAVAHEHHAARRGSRARRVEMGDGALQRILDRLAVHPERQVGGVVHLPHLVVLAQRLVAQHLVGDVDPCLRAAREAVQHDDGAPRGIVGLHEVDAWCRQAVFHAQQAAHGLHREPRAREPQAVARREIAGQRHLAPREHDLRRVIRIVEFHLHVVRFQYLAERASVEAQQGGGGGVGHLAEGLLRFRCHLQRAAARAARQGRIARRLHGRDQLGAETVAAVGVAQAGEPQRGRGDQLAGFGGPAGQAQVGGVAAHAPAAPLQAPAGRQLAALRRHGTAVAREHARQGLLGGEVVVVAYLGLAVFEGARFRAARREEEVGPGVSGGFQPGVQLLVLVGGGFGTGAGGPAVAAGPQGGEQPELRQGGQALLLIDTGRGREHLPAGGHVLIAGIAVGAQHAQHLLGGLAQPPGGEHVATALREVVARRYGRDGDARASCQQRGEAEQRGTERQPPHRGRASGRARGTGVEAGGILQTGSHLRDTCGAGGEGLCSPAVRMLHVAEAPGTAGGAPLQ